MREHDRPRDKDVADRARGEEDAARDPIIKLGKFIVREGILTQPELDRLRGEVDAEINQATDRALTFPQPPKSSALKYVYSPDIDPTSPEFDTEAQAKLSGKPLMMSGVPTRPSGWVSVYVICFAALVPDGCMQATFGWRAGCPQAAAITGIEPDMVCRWQATARPSPRSASGGSSVRHQIGRAHV